MASVHKRKGKYVVIYDYKDANDNRKQKWKSFDSKLEATKFKNEIETAKITDTFINPSRVTVKEFLDEWVDIHAKSKWQYKTYLNAKSMLDNHIIPMIGDVELQQLTPKDVEIFINNLRFKKVAGSKSYNKEEDEVPNLSPTTVGHIHTFIKTALDKAVEWRLIPYNPVMCKKPPRAKVDITIWDVDDVKTALDDIDHDQLHLAVHLAFICSLRIGEVMGLTWDCVDLDNLIIYVNKTLQRVTKESVSLLPSDNLTMVFPSRIADSKSVLLLKTPKTSSSNRMIYIPRELRDELQQRKEQVMRDRHYHEKVYQDYNLVFSLDDGYPVEPKLCEKWFKKWQKATTYELPEIIFHALRHSSTTYKLSLTGGDIKSVQGDTGHATADMIVNRYSHIQDKSRQRMLSLVEKDFYGKAASDETPSETDISINLIMELIRSNPAIQKKILTEIEQRD